MAPMTRTRAAARMSRFGRVVRRRLYGRRRVFRRVATKLPVFTETVRLPRNDVLLTGAGTTVGQMFVTPVSDIPQWSNYAELYNQYKILGVTYYLMPAWTASDQEWASNAIPQPRFVYAIQDSSGAPNPTAEIDILNDNGCKIRQSQKALVIKTRPAPQLQVQAVGGATSAWMTQKSVFLSTSASQPISFGLVSYACTTDAPLPVGGYNARVYSVYVKIRFMLKDPK